MTGGVDNSIRTFLVNTFDTFLLVRGCEVIQFIEGEEIPGEYFYKWSIMQIRGVLLPQVDWVAWGNGVAYALSM